MRRMQLMSKTRAERSHTEHTEEERRALKDSPYRSPFSDRRHRGWHLTGSPGRRDPSLGVASSADKTVGGHATMSWRLEKCSSWLVSGNVTLAAVAIVFCVNSASARCSDQGG